MIEQLRQKLAAFLWPPQLPAQPTRGVVIAARYLYALGREAFDGQLSLRAMSLVYTTMLAVVPLLAFSFSILKGLGFHRQMEPLLAQFMAPLGAKGEELTRTIVGFVDNVQGTTLAGLSLGFLLFTVLSMAQKVEDSFNFVWRVDRPRSFARRFSEYLSVMLVGPVVMTFAMGITASISSTALMQRLAEVEPLGTGIVMLGRLVPYLLVVAAFTFLYAFVPNTRVRLGSAALGGIVAGVLWAAGGSLFAQFVVAAARTEVIYSGFAIVIVAMLWLYLSWVVLLYGAQLAFYHQNPEHLRFGRRTPSMGNDVRERLALTTMLLVARDFITPGHGWRVASLAAHMEIPAHQLAPIVQTLTDAGLLTATADDRLVPAKALATIKVREVLAAVRSGDQRDQALSWDPPVERIAGQVQQAIDRAVGNRTLAELAQAVEEPGGERNAAGEPVGQPPGGTVS